jgi:hypothetical protein
VTARHRSWRDIYPVHPAAAAFPMMSDEELEELGRDIREHGLKQPIVLWSEVLGSSETKYQLDGRNRLDAMEMVGMRTVSSDGCLTVTSLHVSAKVLIQRVTAGPSDVEERPGRVPDSIAYVISANIKRRHLTKKQQADLIVKVVATSKADSAKLARSVKRDRKGQVRGSTKDPIKEQVVHRAAVHDISPRTAERALADHRAITSARERKPKTERPEPNLNDAIHKAFNQLNGALMRLAVLAERKLDAELREFMESPEAGEIKRAYVTCSECAARVADLDHHLKLKHKAEWQRRQRGRSS